MGWEKVAELRDCDGGGDKSNRLAWILGAAKDETRGSREGESDQEQGARTIRPGKDQYGFIGLMSIPGRVGCYPEITKLLT